MSVQYDLAANLHKIRGGAPPLNLLFFARLMLSDIGFLGAKFLPPPVCAQLTFFWWFRWLGDVFS